MDLTLLHHDDRYVFVHKPAGMLVHRSRIAQDRVFVMQTLRDQLGVRVYPVHRLDRATSGVLAFGLDPGAARRLAGEFADRRVAKRYLAVARGWLAADGMIDHPITDDEGNARPAAALTRYRRLARIELAEPVDRYPTARYSLACVEPLTGRRQQIRKHFKHISHHLIGDTTHGNGRHNRFFRDRLDLHRLLLLAYRLRLTHPYTGEPLDVRATLDDDWTRVLALFGLTGQTLEDC